MTEMKKIISFSLWGEDPKYTVGAIRNAELAPKIYPGWTCRYYVGASTPVPIVAQLETFDHVEVVEMKERGDWRGMFWRFTPASEEDVEIMISRDTDCRLNLREKAAVDAWVESDKEFHIMRDHPWHGYPVLGGMWGAKKGCVPHLNDWINNFSQRDAYGIDYKFFAEIVLPRLDPERVMIHDEFFTGSPFPTPRNDDEFVGEVIDETESRVPDHVKALRMALSL